MPRGAQTRQRITDGALRLFAEKGVDATSIRDIASSAAITEPAIYRHFRSKEDLVWEIFWTGYRGLGEKLAGIEPEGGLRERIAAMVDAHALPGKDQLEADATLRQSELSVTLANAKLASLRVSQQNNNEFTVLAPRGGFIVDKHVLPAEQVSASQDLVEVADVSSVWAVAEVFEADTIALQAGTPVSLTRAELPGFAVEGTVEMVSSVVDPERHTVSVRVVVPNPDLRLRPNTYVEMRFRQQPTPGSVEIGAAALVSDGADKYVYVEQGAGRFVRRQVTAGSSSKNRVVVTSGLSPGDRVVEEGSALLDNEIVLSN